MSTFEDSKAIEGVWYFGAYAASAVEAALAFGVP